MSPVALQSHEAAGPRRGQWWLAVGVFAGLQGALLSDALPDTTYSGVLSTLVLVGAILVSIWTGWSVGTWSALLLATIPALVYLPLLLLYPDRFQANDLALIAEVVMVNIPLLALGVAIRLASLRHRSLVRQCGEPPSTLR